MARYADLNLAGSEYIPQYAGAPLAEIQQTADKLASRHYSNLANASQLEILANQMKSKLLPGAKGYVDQHITALDSAIQEMAKSGGENSTARINALATALQSDQGILNAQARTSEYNSQTELINKAKATGEIPLFNAQARTALEQAPADSELYQAPYDYSTEIYRDPNPEMEEIWKVTNPDSIEGTLHAAMNTTPDKLGLEEALGSNNIPLFFETIAKGGIEGTKINNLLEGAWSNYKNSPSYKQQTGELIGLTPGMKRKAEAELKQEFYNKGLQRVFNNVKRDYRATPAAALNSGSGSPATTVTVPTPAAVRDIDQLKRATNSEWVDPGDITKTGVRKSFIGNSLDYLANEAESVLMAVQGRKEGETKEQFAERQKANNARADEILSGKNRDAAKTKQAINDFKTVMDVAGFQATVANPGISVGTSKKDPSAMTDREILALAATPEGRSMMKSYQDTYQKLRYSMPFIQIPVEEGARQANEDFIRGSFDLRQIIDPVSGTHYGNIRDEDGEINDDLSDLHRALVNKTAIYTGEFTPQNLLTEIDNSGENFVKGRKIIAPSEDGLSSKEYYIGELPTLTQPSDINENVLFRRATETPGAKVPVGKGVDIQVLASPQQKESVYNKQGAKWSLDYPTFTKEKFMNGQAVLVSVEGQTIPFANYTAAAQYLASKGIKLDIK